MLRTEDCHCGGKCWHSLDLLQWSDQVKSNDLLRFAIYGQTKTNPDPLKMSYVVTSPMYGLSSPREYEQVPQILSYSFLNIIYQYNLLNNGLSMLDPVTCLGLQLMVEQNITRIH